MFLYIYIYLQYGINNHVGRVYTYRPLDEPRQLLIMQCITYIILRLIQYKLKV